MLEGAGEELADGLQRGLAVQSGLSSRHHPVSGPATAAMIERLAARLPKKLRIFFPLTP